MFESESVRLSKMNLNREEKVIEFISFCIENYKIKHSISGKYASDIFNKNGLINFLEESYDLLHCHSKQYILEEIEKYLSIRGEIH